MAIPGPGNPLVMGKIYQEVDGAGYSASADPNEIVTLAGLVGGAPDTINQASASKPDTSTPHSMSEWYNYDHSASSFTWGTPNTFPNTFFDQEMETTDGSRSQVATVMKITHSSGQVNYQAIDMGRNFAPSGSTAGLNTDSIRNVSYTGTLTALYIQYVFTSIDNTIVQDSIDCVAEIRKDTNSSPNEPDAAGYSLVQTLSTGTNQNITGTITQIGHTGTSAYWVMIETGSSGGTDTDTIRLRNGTVACKLYANSTSGPSVTLFTGKTVDMLAYSSDDSS
jgi:hypothetical protein